MLDFPEQAYRQAANTPDSFDYDAWTECFHGRAVTVFSHTCSFLLGMILVLVFLL